MSCDGLSGGVSLIAVVKPTNFSDLDHAPAINFVNVAMLWAIHLKRQVCRHFLKTHVMNSLFESMALDLVVVSKQVLGRDFPRECLGDLLCSPLRRWIGGDVEVQDATTVMSNHKKNV